MGTQALGRCYLGSILAVFDHMVSSKADDCSSLLSSSFFFMSNSGDQRHSYIALVRFPCSANDF